MIIPVPYKEAVPIANRAAQIARAYGIARGWTATRGLEPIAKNGFIGIYSPYKFLLYQNFGTKPRLMTELEGRVILMRDAGGAHFVTVRGVGTPGYVTLPGGVRIWRDQKWRHPGIKPTHFLENSLNQAARENLPQLMEGFKKLLCADPQQLISGPREDGNLSGYHSSI